MSPTGVEADPLWHTNCQHQQVIRTHTQDTTAASLSPHVRDLQVMESLLQQRHCNLIKSASIHRYTLVDQLFAPLATGYGQGHWGRHGYLSHIIQTRVGNSNAESSWVDCLNGCYCSKGSNAREDQR